MVHETQLTRRGFLAAGMLGTVGLACGTADRGAPAPAEERSAQVPVQPEAPEPPEKPGTRPELPPVPEGPPKAARERNVVLLVAGSLRADRFEAGDNGTPVMRRMSALSGEGAWRFNNCLAQGATCGGALASLFTAVYGGVHGLQGACGGEAPGSALLDSIPTAAAAFHEAGWYTACVRGDAAAPGSERLERGFEFYRAVPAGTRLPAHEVNEMGRRLMAAAERPFFLCLHYADIYAPWPIPGTSGEEAQPPPAVFPRDREARGAYAASHLGLAAGQPGADLPEADRAQALEQYDEACQTVDREATRLIEHIRGAFPNTWVVFTADHGEELFERGGYGHGGSVYQEVARVPLLMFAPRQEAKTIETPVQHIDVLPTLAGALGVPRQAQWQGLELTEERLAAAVVRARPRYIEAHTADRRVEAIVWEGHKLVRRSGGEEEPQHELYDLAGDPGETVNLHGERAAISERLEARLANHRAANAANPWLLAQPHSAEIEAGGVD